MATYCKMWNTLIEAPDPDGYTAIDAIVMGRFSQGLPVVQGRESHVLTWTVMSLSDWHDMYALYDSNKTSSGSFVIPPKSGDSWTSWRTKSAFCDPPTAEYRGNQVHNVSVTLHVIKDLA